MNVLHTFKKIPICTLLHGSFEKYHFIKNITKIEDQLIIIYLLIRLPLKVAGQLGKKAMGLILFRLPIYKQNSRLFKILNGKSKLSISNKVKR